MSLNQVEEVFTSPPLPHTVLLQENEVREIYIKGQSRSR